MVDTMAIIINRHGVNQIYRLLNSLQIKSQIHVFFCASISSTLAPNDFICTVLILHIHVDIALKFILLLITLQSV